MLHEIKKNKENRIKNKQGIGFADDFYVHRPQSDTFIIISSLFFLLYSLSIYEARSPRWRFALSVNNSGSVNPRLLNDTEHKLSARRMAGAFSVPRRDGENERTDNISAPEDSLRRSIACRKKLYLKTAKKCDIIYLELYTPTPL